jgi:sugar phosphate isomerase/epimerase
MILGVQTYTIRKKAKINPQDAFDELINLGIHHIELARLELNNDLITIIKKKKIEVLSLQLKLKELDKKFESITHFCKQVNCHLVVVSVLSFDAILLGKRAVLRFCSKLNHLSKRYEEKGIQVAFHHHHFEFRKISGISKLELIIANTDKKIKIVTDTYWAKKSGVEPHEILVDYQDRIIGIHLRDYIKNIFKRSRDCEVGYGLIDFNEVFNHIGPNILYAVIEQNTRYPFYSLSKSIQYLKDNHKEIMFDKQ